MQCAVQNSRRAGFTADWAGSYAGDGVELCAVHQLRDRVYPPGNIENKYGAVQALRSTYTVELLDS